MDFFSRLPSELRIEVLEILYQWEKEALIQLTKASSIMLEQYNKVHSSLVRSYIAANLDEELMQDCLAIILFPPTRKEYHTSLENKIHRHLREWGAQKFPNPLKQSTPLSNRRLASLERLCRRVYSYMEDFVAKATSSYPPRSYLCLPDFFSPRTRLIFKGKVISEGFKIEALRESERKFLFWAFLRYELLCKVNYPAPRWNLKRRHWNGLENFQPREL